MASNLNESNAERMKLGITNQEDQDALKSALEKYDAVLTTFQTMRHERGAIRTKLKPQIPWFVAMSKHHKHKLDRYKHASQSIWTQPGVPVNNLTFSEEFSLSDFLDQLSNIGIKKVAYLGGPSLFRMLVDEKAIEEVHLTETEVKLNSGICLNVNFDDLAKWTKISSHSDNSNNYTSYKFNKPL